MVRNLVGLKARLTWNGIRNDTQRRFGFPVATILLGWAGWYLATALVETAAGLEGEALAGFLGWAALLFFAGWVTLPVIIFPLDENLDPQQLAVLPITHGQMVTGLSAASFVAPATVVPILVLAANASILATGWWMVVPASLVFAALMTVGSQLFSAAISAILRTRRGRDVATFLILGIAAGSFFVYRSISETIDDIGLASAVLDNPILKLSWLLPPVAAQRAILEAATGNTFGAIVQLAAAVAGLFVLAYLWKRLLGWMLTTPAEGSKPAARARRSGFTSGLWGVVPTLNVKSCVSTSGTPGRDWSGPALSSSSVSRWRARSWAPAGSSISGAASGPL